MLQSDTNNLSIPYRFIIDPRFSIWRHIAMILSILIISMNQGFSVFDYNTNDYLTTAYIFTIVFLVGYCFVGYTNIYILIPKFFFKKKYALYVVYIFLLMVCFIMLQAGVDYYTITVLKAPAGTNSFFNDQNTFLVDISSTFVTISVSIIGVSAFVLLKHWMIDNQRISRLEKEQTQSELEQLKDRITPVFLSKTLNSASKLTKTEPQKANEILLKISMVLRYQLYDCSRDKVLLNSEANFIRNYLNLQQLCSDNFTFKMEIEGNTAKIMIPPLLFITFIQNSIDNIPDKGDRTDLLYICFQIQDNKINFLCSGFREDSLNTPVLLKNKRRFDLLFPDKYTLEINNKSNTLKLQLNL